MVWLALLMVSVRFCLSVSGVGVLWSETFTVKVNVPPCVGVPLIRPVELKLSPVGKLPPNDTHVCVPRPPSADNWNE